MSRASDAARFGGTPVSRRLLLGVLGAEILVLAFAFLLDQPVLAPVLALGLAFLVLAVRAPDAAWALTWLAVPLSVERLISGGNAISVPSEPMIALSLLGWLVRRLLDGAPRWRPSPLHGPLAVAAVVALASVLASPFPVVGLKAWVVTAAYAAFGYLYVSQTPCDPRRRERWIRLVVATGAFWGLYGAARVLQLGVSLQHAYGATRPFFMEHGTYSAYLAMILPLALLRALERRGGEARLYGLAALALSLGLVLSFTRAAWVSLVVVLPPTLWIWARARGGLRRLAPGALLAAPILVFVIGLGVTDRLGEHAQSIVERDNVSNLERLNRWMAALAMVRDRPWTGVGYGGYAAAYPAYRHKTIVTELAYEHMGVHNELLRLAAETGLPGLLTGLWFLGSAGALGMAAFRRARDPERGTLALALVAGLGTYAVHGLFNSYLGMDKVTAPFWLGLGALAACIERPGRRGAPGAGGDAAGPGGSAAPGGGVAREGADADPPR